MSLRHAWIPALLAATLPATSLAAFRDCESARNAGWDTAHSFVQGALANRCSSADRMNLAIAMVQRVTETYVWNMDVDSEIVCLYAGYFDGLLQNTSAEFERCGDVSNFACISEHVIAGYAEATFVALFKALDRPGDLSPDTIKSMMEPAPALADYSIKACDVVGQQACRDYIYGRIALDLGYTPPASFVDALVAAVCVR